MCGIYGYFDRARDSVDNSTLHGMAQAISHRGPDGHGYWYGHGVAIGNQRLAIIDPDGGWQPFYSDDRKIAVVQNGEIFNYVELAQHLSQHGIDCRTECDTEVILRLYEKYGIDFVSQLNGMFAIAIYDQRIESLYLIRDRIGEKPLYLHDDGKRLLFASEIKSLLRADVSVAIDDASMDAFLALNFIPPPYTIYRGIRHLMPGHWMKVSSSSTQIKQWWDLSQFQAEQRDELEWIELFNATLEDAVRIRLRSDVPFGAFLSGGVDSSTVVGLMARQLDRPVRTFCIGFQEERFDESPYALEASMRFGTEHVMRRVNSNLLDLWPRAIWHCDQPHGDMSFLPTLSVSELAVEHVKMVLTGDGADELFAGYDKFKNFFADPSSQTCELSEFRERYYQAISLFSDQRRSQLCGMWKPKENLAYETVMSMFEAASQMDRVNQTLYLDMMLLLPGNNLVKPDRMSMAVGLETRAPFLDYRMMELAFRIPGDLKLRGGVTKYIYKKAVTPLIGSSLAYRKKQMFTVPVGEWLRSGLSALSRDLLTSTRVNSRGLFTPGLVQSMLSQHQAGTENHTRELRAMMAVEIWCREFLDDLQISCRSAA